MTASYPYYLAGLVEALQRIDKPKADIRILEHGCGGGAALFALVSLGYTNVHGVDVAAQAHADELNRKSEAAGLGGGRFFSYDGSRLPFDDDSFDFVFSQQVLEHVAPDVLRAYYSEEARVLVRGGIAYHQVPHRLTPYESHMRTWFVHYLPRPLDLWVYRALGRNSDFARDHLFLRSPWFHRSAARRAFGSCEDRTLQRLVGLTIDERNYHGNIRLRRMIARIARLPVFGVLIKELVMLDTVSIKK
jgi:SAM-dependent methyltransferase